MQLSNQHINEAVIVSWGGTSGCCDDGKSVRLGSSCLIQPVVGDRVLVTNQGNADEYGAIIAILERPLDTSDTSTLKLAIGANLYLNAPEINIRTGKLLSHSNDLISHAINRHIVEGTRTLNAKIRVAEVERDQRVAKNVEDAIRGGLLQRFGSWLSDTATEVRMKASSFIYDKYSK